MRRALRKMAEIKHKPEPSKNSPEGRELNRIRRILRKARRDLGNNTALFLVAGSNKYPGIGAEVSVPFQDPYMRSHVRLHKEWSARKGYSKWGKSSGSMRKVAGTATKTDPQKWEQAKKDAKAKMRGKHSARAMQLATQLYKKRGGGYSGSKPTSKSNSLKKWTDQNWGWTGGKKNKGIYLPKEKANRLKGTEEGRKKLHAAGRKKSQATKSGLQYSSHGLASGTSLKNKK